MARDMMAAPQLHKERTLEKKTILIRAEVTHKHDKILTCRLIDCGGNAEVVVREDATIADPNSPSA